jgi:hypothetical protein
MSEVLQKATLIERYFDNAMNEVEKTEFLRALESDLELRELFYDEQVLITSIRFNSAKHTLNYLRQLERTLPPVTLFSSD